MFLKCLTVNKYEDKSEDYVNYFCIVIAEDTFISCVRSVTLCSHKCLIFVVQLAVLLL